MHQDFVALYERWRQKAELFRQHGHEATARTYEVCSGELEAVLREGEEELLDLQEAARESGYSSDHLGRLVRDGNIPNAGRRNAPKIRRGDLPRRPEVVARWHARDLHERAQRAAGYGYSCPKCKTDLGNEQRECTNGKCGHVDRLPRDPAKKLLGFHAYRRKWATEKKRLPAKDVAEAGGWLDTRSLEECYQQADEATLLQVVWSPGSCAKP